VSQTGSWSVEQVDEQIVEQGVEQGISIQS
jgi:hypothetical protein